MKRTNKKLFGFLGLTAVAAITTFAVFLPTPEAQAAGSVTDYLTVRVVGPEADIEIIRPNDGADFVNPNQTIDYDYVGARKVTVTLEYPAPDGTVVTEVLKQMDDLDYESGVDSINLNLNDPKYGYGRYVVKVACEGTDGVFKEDAIEFTYVPVTAEAEQSTEKEGEVNVDLNYDETNENIDTIVINVYDEDGNLIEGLSPVIVQSPNKTVALDFMSYGLEPGTYIITATACDKNGNPLYEPYVTKVNYAVPEKAVPNTGSVFQNANISKTDYLITGLIVFGLVAMAGTVTILKHNRQDSKQSNRRRK